jgi:integrase
VLNIDPKTGEPKRDKWKRVVKRYSGLNFHDLRRTFVTDCENAGVPRHEAMAMSGHKTESVYKRYAIGNTERRRAEVSRLSTWRNENREKTGRIEDSGAKERNEEPR